MTRALIALLDIMQSQDVRISRRIEAASGILFGRSSPEAMATANDFLTAVFESEDIEVAFRLNALKLMRKAEALGTSIPMDQRLERNLAIAGRRLDLWRAGLWPAPSDWADDLRIEARHDDGDLATKLRRARESEISLAKSP